MMLQLPLRTDIWNYEFRASLDGSIYVLAFRYNERKGRWIMDIKASDNAYLVMGIPILLGVDLLGKYGDERLPPGKFILIDTTGQNLEAGKTDLGDRVILLYQEAT